MSQFVPSTLVAVFRNGTVPDTADAWGNPVPPTAPTADQADARDLPALLVDAGVRTSQPASGRADIVRRYRLRLRPGAVPFEVTPQDRVLDQRTGRYFAVDEVPEATGIVQEPDLLFVLRRVS